MAVLKAIVENLDDVPEAVREFYKEADGVGFVLGVDGITAHPGVLSLKNAHETQKASNRKVKEQLAEALAKLEQFGDTTPDEIEELRTRAEGGAATGKGATAPTEEQINEIVEKRWGIARAKSEKQIEAQAAQIAQLTGDLGKTNQALAVERIDNKLKTHAVEGGVRKNALDLLIKLGRDVWRLGEDGEPVAMNGDEPMSGAHGPISMGEWIEAQRARHDYLFEPSTGAGGAGNDGATRAGGVLTFAADAPNAIGENLEAFAKGKARLVS